jgi:hypothetical protein
VDGRGVGRNQCVEFAEPVGDGAAIEAGGELAIIGINIVDGRCRRYRPPCRSRFRSASPCRQAQKSNRTSRPCALRWVHRRLQFNVERACADAAPIHGGQNLDVANGVEAKALGNPCLYQLNDARHGSFGIVCRHQVKVAIGSGCAKIGNKALVDAMGAGDDATLRGLPEYFGEATTGTAPDEMTSASTWPGPTEGSWSMSPTTLSESELVSLSRADFAGEAL